MNELALFAGAGGGILGGKLLGWRTVCAVERDGYAASVLAQRQNDGHIEPFPIWSDVCTFDGRPWRGIVDVVSGGFPCQDISSAGKGAGIDGERSGLWTHMARIISEVRPKFVFVENSPLLVSRGLALVLSDLAKMGFDAKWGIVGAHHVGAPHKRDRCWIVANANRNQCAAGSQLQSGRHQRRQAPFTYGSNDMADADSQRFKKQHAAAITNKARQYPWRIAAERRAGWWTTEPDVGRVAHGVANRVDRLKALGNGQVPLAAALAWNILSKN